MLNVNHVIERHCSAGWTRTLQSSKSLCLCETELSQGLQKDDMESTVEEHEDTLRSVSADKSVSCRSFSPLKYETQIDHLGIKHLTCCLFRQKQ